VSRFDIDRDDRNLSLPSDIGADEVARPIPKVDLSITKSDGVGAVYRASPLTYTIVVTNNSTTDPVTGAVVTDSRPSGITNGSWSWSCAPTGSNGCGTSGNSGGASINKTLGTLAPGASVTFTVQGTVSNNATAGNLVNTATVAAPSTVSDSNAANDSATDTDTIVVGAGTATITTPTGGTLDFGNLSGATNTSTVTVSVQSGSVTFGPAYVTNTTGAAFSVVTDNCSGKTVSATPAATRTCTIVVNFNAPGGSSNRSGTLTVPSDAANSPRTVSLSGR
jgi:uncharacterized repeat protein (TIGR01451 family)